MQSQKRSQLFPLPEFEYKCKLPRSSILLFFLPSFHFTLSPSCLYLVVPASAILITLGSGFYFILPSPVVPVSVIYNVRVRFFFIQPCHYLPSSIYHFDIAKKNYEKKPTKKNYEKKN